MNKIFSFSLFVAILMTVSESPAFAKPTTFYGGKGKYTIDFEAGTYRGCIKGGGCISLRRKHLISSCNQNSSYECEITRWKNGGYIYEAGQERINVIKNGRTVFSDYLN